MEARPRSGLLVGFAGCVAVVLSIVYLDRPAALWSHRVLHGASVFPALTHLIDPIPPLAVFGFLILALVVAKGWRRGRFAFTFLYACMAVLIVIAVKDQAKFAFGRLWPETWVNNNPSWIKDGAYGFFPFHGGAGWGSFPSGHMAVITAPATVFWLRYPSWRWLAILPVILVAVGLYGADYHFIGDIIAGTLLGVVCGAGVLALQTRE